MPVAGTNRKGFWMKVVDNVLVIEKGEKYSQVVVDNFDKAVERLMNGERVHVHSTFPFPFRVSEEVNRRILARSRHNAT